MNGFTKSLAAICAASAFLCPPAMAREPHSGIPPREQVARSESGGKILGGLAALEGQFPFQVSLFRLDQGHFCGGTLIDERWVLTAAHCVTWMPEDPLEPHTRILVGTNNLFVGGQTLDVVRVIPHPDYNDATHENDIALLELAPQSAPRMGAATRTLSPFTTPASMSRSLTGNAIVTGYGTTENDKISPQLLYVEVPVVTNETCNRPESYDGAIADSMICAGEAGKDSCQGDSGGPLVMKRGEDFVLVGVVSFGQGCGLENKYGVYTRVSSFLEWIRTTMATPPAPPPAPAS